MNPTLYTQLSPLGFTEWLEKNEWRQSIVALEDADNNFNIDSSIRTTFNALAFRWLREDKDIDITVKAVYPFIYNYRDNYPKKVYVAFFANEAEDIYIDVKNELAINHFQTHELAEHEALNKALEILSKGGENG